MVPTSCTSIQPLRFGSALKKIATMNRQEFLRCVAEEINHALENGIATRLLVLLPQFL